MKNKHSKLREKLSLDAQSDQVLVSDVIRYLSGLAKLHRSDKTGNTELSNGLLDLGNALRPYATYPVRELADAIKQAQPASERKSLVRKPKATLPPNLESLQQDDIEKILTDDSYTKIQIAELGFQRFGISKPMLQRLRKEEARRSVRSALDNERTLDVISEMARKAGKARAS